MVQPIDYPTYCRFKQIEQEYRLAQGLNDKKLLAKASAKVINFTKQVLQVDLLKMINDEVKALEGK